MCRITRTCQILEPSRDVTMATVQPADTNTLHHHTASLPPNSLAVCNSGKDYMYCNGFKIDLTWTCGMHGMHHNWVHYMRTTCTSAPKAQLVSFDLVIRELGTLNILWRSVNSQICYNPE
jgi:hypothetical protein